LFAVYLDDLSNELNNIKAGCYIGEVLLNHLMGCYLVCFVQVYDGCIQGCGVGVVRSRRFLGGVGFLTTLGVGVGFFCPTPTPDVHLDHFLHHTPKLGIPVEIVQSVLKLLLKYGFLAVHYDFH